LFLSGEHFRCSDSVVVTDATDLNHVSMGAQLASALEAPLLFSHPQVAAEIGRLQPSSVYLLGDLEVISPPDAEVSRVDIATAADMVKTTLGVSEEVATPATPDSSTVIETVQAIINGDRVAVPAVGPGASTTTANSAPNIDTAEVVRGLAGSTEADAIWMVDAATSATVLLSASAGGLVDAVTVAVDGTDLLGYPELASTLEGHDSDQIRLIGPAPEGNEWELAVLANGKQVPGGGFTILPNERLRRYVAFYGHPDTTALGVLGEQDGAATIERMQPFLDAYQGDGAQTIPTFEIIATVASAGPGEDGNYSYEWPAETFDDLFATAEANDAYILLDLQPGRSDFLTQAKLYEDLLMLPNVGLALDPEWRLGPNQVHLQQVGNVNAAEVNEVVTWLGDLVRDNGLPQKMLLLHMFRTTMITERETLIDRPELQVVIQMDGDGTEAQKDNTWAQLRTGFEDAFWSWGWKNFFDEDEPGPPTPESTMSKKPTPVYVSYQ